MTNHETRPQPRDVPTPPRPAGVRAWLIAAAIVGVTLILGNGLWLARQFTPLKGVLGMEQTALEPVGLEVVKQVAPGKAGIFCLGGLPTESQSVLDKTRTARRIITVDGCLLNCSRKIVEQAGFTPHKTINLVEDCGIKKGPTFSYTDEDMRVAVKAILSLVNGE
jgi:uncharacterized metal-binding protein